MSGLKRMEVWELTNILDQIAFDTEVLIKCRSYDNYGCYTVDLYTLEVSETEPYVILSPRDLWISDPLCDSAPALSAP